MCYNIMSCTMQQNIEKREQKLIEQELICHRKN